MGHPAVRSGREAGDEDVVWGKAGVVALDDGGVGGLQMAGEGLAIEERSGGAVLLQALAEGLEAFGVVSEIDGEFLVLRLRCRDEFGQAGGAQQAGGDPAGKGLAGACQDWQADPERIAGRGVRVVGRVSRKRSARRCRARCSFTGSELAKTSRWGAMPRRAASVRRFSTAQGFSSSSQRTLPSTRPRMRIQLSNTAGDIL